jgi:hypothetical protein
VRGLRLRVAVVELVRRLPLGEILPSSHHCSLKREGGPKTTSWPVLATGLQETVAV